MFRTSLIAWVPDPCQDQSRGKVRTPTCYTTSDKFTPGDKLLWENNARVEKGLVFLSCEEGLTWTYNSPAVNTTALLQRLFGQICVKYRPAEGQRSWGLTLHIPSHQEETDDWHNYKHTSSPVKADRRTWGADEG
ncbi:hypothetical protein Bbelb_338290 [Branchiostoma belcheri]|nr:hypothetical protein Bbelb_338290 [Branchiostoma belcheri]